MAWMTALAVGSMIASTVISARAAKKAAKEQQLAAEVNAAEATKQAMDAEQRGEEGVNLLTREVRHLQGTQRAGYAAQGVDVNLGTPVAAGRDADALLASDVARIRRNAEREALGFTSEAENLRTQGRYARSAGHYAVAGTILGGTAQTALLAQRQWGNR